MCRFDAALEDLSTRRESCCWLKRKGCCGRRQVSLISSNFGWNQVSSRCGVNCVLSDRPKGSLDALLPCQHGPLSRFAGHNGVGGILEAGFYIQSSHFVAGSVHISRAATAVLHVKEAPLRRLPASCIMAVGSKEWSCMFKAPLKQSRREPRPIPPSILTTTLHEPDRIRRHAPGLVPIIRVKAREKWL
jgi:hypothetical protein